MYNMRLLLLLSFLCFSQLVTAQDGGDQAVRKVLMDQQDAWNRGDIPAFMKGYWQSDSLMFIGGAGITYGYGNTWERYKKTYDSPAKMGKLAFTLLHLNRLSPDTYMVVGKWQLTRTVGDIGGHFTLIFKQINGQWLIISDHTSAA